MVIDEHQAKCLEMLKTAEGYSKSALILSGTRERDVLMPSTIMAAFSLEIHFKCLYFALCRTDFKLKDRNGGERHSHDFLKIFDDLDVKIKSRMEVSFKSALVDRDRIQQKDFERISGKKISTGLRDTIAAWSDVFEKWRYHYDMSNGGYAFKTTLFFQAIEFAIRDALFTALPELLDNMHRHNPDKMTILGRSK